MKRIIKKYRLYDKYHRDNTDLTCYEDDIISAIRQVSYGRNIEVYVYSNEYHVYGNYTPAMARKAGQIMAHNGCGLANYCVFKYGGYKLFVKFEEETYEERF